MILFLMFLSLPLIFLCSNQLQNLAVSHFHNLGLKAYLNIRMNQKLLCGRSRTGMFSPLTIIFFV